MNRDQENDPIWKAIAAHPDERTLVVKVNYYDNPHCPEEMKYLAEKCKQENIDDFEHIWLGAPQNQGDTKLIAAKPLFQNQVVFLNNISTSSSSFYIFYHADNQYRTFYRIFCCKNCKPS